MHAQNNLNDDFKEAIISSIKENNFKLTADKILTTLDSIRNNPNISSKRWVWELMQNATDVRNDNERISVNIIISNDKLEFKHNGKYFHIKNLLGLLQQVSSKNSQNLEGQTGKFGTGFIGTHLLSDIIDVEGILYIQDDEFRKFNIRLDRSKKNSEDLAIDIKKSIETVMKIREQDNLKVNYLQNRKENDYDTCFTYYLTDDIKKKAAKDGLNDLINTVPPTLITQHKKIKQISIIDKEQETETTYISEIGNENENDITESLVKKTIITSIDSIHECKEEKIIYFLSYLRADKGKNILRLIFQVEKKDGKVILLKRDEKKQPVLYRNFPLIGSNEFDMPFIVDGFDFNPLEARNGILLNGGNNINNLDVQENLNILENAYDSSIEFIKCIINKYNNLLEKRYILAYNQFPKPIVNFDSFAEKWFYEKLINYRKKLKDLILVEYGEDKKNLSKLSELLLPIFNGECENDFYNIVSNLNIKKKIIPYKQYYKDWYNIIIGLSDNHNKYIHLWGITKDENTNKEKVDYIYDKNDFLEDLVKCKNLKTLCKTVELSKYEVIEKLNDFVRLLKGKSNYEDILNAYPILPNRNGDFKKVKDLCSDDQNPIPLYIINLYDSISNEKLNDQLIDNNIYFEYLGEIIRKKNFNDIIGKINAYILEKKDLENTKKLAYGLLLIKTDNKTITKIYEFLSFFHNSNQTEILMKNKGTMPIDLWDYALKFWFEEFPKEIERCENIEGLKSKLSNQKEDNTYILQWMNTLLAFLKKHSDSFENLKIFPNQNGNFCYLNTLYFDSGFPEEFKIILKKYFNIDKKEVLLNKEITTYSSFKIMYENEITKEIESEFNKLKQNEIQNKEKLLAITIEILCLYPINIEKEPIKKYLEKIICPIEKLKEKNDNSLDYFGFAEIIYNKQYSSKIKKITTNDLNYILFINYLIEKICDEISTAGNLTNIKKKFSRIKNKEDLEKFLIEIIKFIWGNQNNEYQIRSCIDNNTSEKAIFLNMYNELLPLNKICFKDNSNFNFNCKKEDEDILFKICKNKHINEDPLKGLLNGKLNRDLKDYKDKFRYYDIKNLCSKIDNVIMKYDQNNRYNDNIYDSDFNEVLQDLMKLKFDKKIKEELFPYYSKNIRELTMNCIDKELTENILSIITQNPNECLKILKENLNRDKNIYSGNDHVCRNYLTMNQKFMFKLKIFDNNKNEKIINSKSINIKPEKILVKGDENIYDNAIEFEIDSLDDFKNDELKIIYNKK